MVVPIFSFIVSFLSFSDSSSAQSRVRVHVIFTGSFIIAHPYGERKGALSEIFSRFAHKNAKPVQITGLALEFYCLRLPLKIKINRRSDASEVASAAT